MSRALYCMTKRMITWPITIIRQRKRENTSTTIYQSHHHTKGKCASLFCQANKNEKKQKWNGARSVPGQCRLWNGLQRSVLELYRPKRERRFETLTITATSNINDNRGVCVWTLWHTESFQSQGSAKCVLTAETRFVWLPIPASACGQLLSLSPSVSISPSTLPIVNSD